MVPTDPARQDYANPPIEEALCQVVFKERLAWSVATPGKLFDALESDYPHEPEAQEQLEATLQVQPAHNNPANLALSRKDLRYVYQDDTKKRLLLINAQNLSVNSLRPYETWPVLRERLRRALHAVDQVTSLKRISQISLRYINRVIIPSAAIDTDDYFSMRVQTANGGKAPFRAFIHRIESVLEPGTLAVTTFATTQTEDPGSAFLLDLDFQRPGLDLESVDEVLAVADELKELENREFETLITDKTRELFK